MDSEFTIEFRLKNFNTKFEIEAQTAGIQVARTDQRVVVVDDDALAVGKGRCAAQDFNARTQ
jgi:hypothetical protein